MAKHALGGFDGVRQMDLTSPDLVPVSPLVRESAILKFAHLVDYHVRIAISTLPAKTDLNDVRQAGMCALIDAFERYDSSRLPSVAFETFANSCIHFAILRCVNSLRAAGSQQIDYEVNNIPDTHRDALAQMCRDELHAEVVRAIKRLPKKDQIRLSLYFIEELKMGEIALIENCSESWVSQCLAKSIRELHRVMFMRANRDSN
jgi:RNA polymerase sigma factor (sigma-70 family)